MQYELKRRSFIKRSGVAIIAASLLPRSTATNAASDAKLGDRIYKSIKEECLSKLILFGETSLRRAAAQFETHFHEERPHQGKGNVILFPSAEENDVSRPIRCRERLGGLLKYYHREAG
jgi:hypothetical protein